MRWYILNALIVGTFLCQCLCEKETSQGYKQIHTDHGLVYNSVIAIGEALSGPWFRNIPPILWATINKEKRDDDLDEWRVKMMFRAKYPRGWKTCRGTVYWRSRTDNTVMKATCAYADKRFHDDKRFKSDIFD